MVHPFMAAYRVPLVNEVGRRIQELGGQLVFAESTPSPGLRGRGDVRTSDYGQQVPTRWLSLRDHHVSVRSLGPLVKELAPELIVVEQALHSVETYTLLARSLRSEAEVGMWGHGRSYSTPQSATMAEAKQWLTRRTKWFFAYTQAGADHVVAGGFPRVRTTVLNNTFDTEALRSDIAAVTPLEVRDFLEGLDCQPGRTALFIGGVDKLKGIDFLLESTRLAAAQLPGFVLLVAGEGDQSADVRAAQAAGLAVRHLGRLDGREKALALASAEIVANPEQIGLVAVDSLTAGRPIVSTRHPFHGPEYEYLQDGYTCLYAEHTPVEYAKSLVGLLADSGRLRAMQEACKAESKKYSIDLMADRFIEGLLAWDEMRRFGL